jgi:septum formation protein
MKIVLASRSPQRRELLERLGLQFEVVAAEVEELGEGEPAEVVLENARRKARAVQVPGAVVIGCDTDVAIEGRLLGKPGDEDEARRFLRLLSGRSHEVLSGLLLAGPEEAAERSGVARSTVTFRDLGEADVEGYLAAGEWRERAGGYAVQGLGATLVARVEGDVSNVIGLPVGLLLELAPELLPG